MTKAHRQPARRATAETTGTASVEPRAVPALKMPMARARSRIGNHSAAARTPAGKFTGWVAPSSSRAPWKPRTELTRPWAMVASDQSDAKTRKLRRVPMRSTTKPPTKYMTM